MSAAISRDGFRVVIGQPKLSLRGRGGLFGCVLNRIQQYPSTCADRSGRVTRRHKLGSFLTARRERSTIAIRIAALAVKMALSRSRRPFTKGLLGFRPLAVVVAAISALALLGPVPAAVRAYHPPFTVRQFFDNDFDGVPDSSIPFYRYGTWTDEKQTQLNQAASEWESRSRFDPVIAGWWYQAPQGSDNFVYQNYVPDPWCGPLPPGARAVNCTQRDYNPTFVRIYDSDIYIANDSRYPYNWSYSSTPTYIGNDFRGALTHELGHAVRIQDLCNLRDCQDLNPNEDPERWCRFESAYLHTMCSPDSLTSGADLYPEYVMVWYRTLTASDIRDANYQYP